MSGEVKIVIVAGNLLEQGLCGRFSHYDAGGRTEDSADLSNFERRIRQLRVRWSHGQQRRAAAGFWIPLQSRCRREIRDSELLSKKSIRRHRESSKWHVVQDTVGDDQKLMDRAQMAIASNRVKQHLAQSTGWLDPLRPPLRDQSAKQFRAGGQTLGLDLYRHTNHR